jgi:hypothetical protein
VVSGRVAQNLGDFLNAGPNGLRLRV